MSDPMPCECLVCGTKWVEEQVFPMEVMEWCNRINRMQCPECRAGVKEIVIRTGPPGGQYAV